MSAIQYISEQSGIDILNNLQKVGEYRLGDVLGEGRFGIVFKGIHIHTGEDVAIKFLKIWSVPDHARLI
jgi:serine/threonine protein kinase